jgi:hypothetical protein
MMNDPLVYPGVMQLPYTEPAFWRERLAGNVGGPAPGWICSWWRCMTAA